MAHQVFISYHHAYPDQGYRERFEDLFASKSLLTSNNVFISKSVQMGVLTLIHLRILYVKKLGLNI